MTKLPEFIPGRDLNRLFFQQVIKPLLDKHFPGLTYSAGLVAEGSDVLGFDTPLSMDHNWGPRGDIFLSENDYRSMRDAIDKMFQRHLPYDFLGFPTNFTKPDEEAYLVQQMKVIKSGPVNHLIRFHTVKGFFLYYLGFDPSKRITRKDWLTFPQQALIEVSGGEIFYDGLRVEKIREKFRYFPDDIWLWMYTTQWGKLGDSLSLISRSGQVGDEVGSASVAADMITKIMKLCFLMEKKYWPYMKWLGTDFSRLKCAPTLTPVLLDAVHAKKWEERQKCVTEALEMMAKAHNELKITSPVQTNGKDFHGRPFHVFDIKEVHGKLYEKLPPAFKKFKYPLGHIDQFIDHPRFNHLDYVYKELKSLMK